MTGMLAALIVLTVVSVNAPVAQAASKKVLIVVGPVGSATSNYRYNAQKLAYQARSYGASVVEIYSPRATWKRVFYAAQSANLVIYLGHGNGYPSPYGVFSQYSKDGMGLNATYDNGNSNTKYYGEYYMRRLQLAPGAVIVLNRLCYASGNSEWGAANPTKSTAIKRIDNYGAGFLGGRAKAVFASGITSVSYVLKALFKGSASMTMRQVFWTDPSRTGTYKFTFASSRTAGASAISDPYAPSRYYRSVIGWLSYTVGAWRSS